MLQKNTNRVQNAKLDRQMEWSQAVAVGRVYLQMYNNDEYKKDFSTAIKIIKTTSYKNYTLGPC